MKRREFLGSLAAGLGSTWLASEHRGLLILSPRGGMPSSSRAGLPSHDRFIQRWSWAMGQPVHLQLFAASDDEGYAAAEDALAELRLVEQHLSLFSEASDLCELNRNAGRKATRVGPDLQRVLERSLELERLTGGAFNPAVEPLMRLWGFRAPRASEPTPGEL